MLSGKPGPVWHKRSLRITGVFVLFASIVTACLGDEPVNAGGSCSRVLAGQWSFDGTCTARSCAVRQDGCRFEIACDDGTRLAGDLSGDSDSAASLSGSTTGVASLSCELGITYDAGSPPRAELSCSAAGRTCELQGRCTTGACAPVEGSPEAGPDARPGFQCPTTAPSVFPPVANAGPYCQNATPSRHCATGTSCCVDLTKTSHVCGTSCGSLVKVGCYSRAECPSGQVCCVRGRKLDGVCPYRVIESLESTFCATRCASDELVACSSALECSGGPCVPAWVAGPDGTTASSVQLPTCEK